MYQVQTQEYPVLCCFGTLPILWFDSILTVLVFNNTLSTTRQQYNHGQCGPHGCEVMTRNVFFALIDSVTLTFDLLTSKTYQLQSS